MLIHGWPPVSYLVMRPLKKGSTLPNVSMVLFHVVECAREMLRVSFLSEARGR